MVADSSTAVSEVADSAWDDLEARVKAHHYTRKKFRTNLGGCYHALRAEAQDIPR